MSSDDVVDSLLSRIERRMSAFNEVWSVLVEECDASKATIDREQFVLHWSGEYQGEYRILGGNLGFGGKFRCDRGDAAWRVDCYPEDETEERCERIGRVNLRLRQILEEYKRKEHC